MVCCYLPAQYTIKDNDAVLSKKEKEALEQVIKYQLDFYNKVQPEQPINPSDVSLNIFSDYGTYLIYQKENIKTTLHRSMGFYSGKNKEAVVCKDKHDKGFMSTCYHELSHFFVNTYFGSVPVWLNEGLAVYFQESKPGKTVRHHIADRYIIRVKTMIDTNDIDTADFVEWDRNRFYKKSFSHENYGYALGYAIVQYLMQKDENIVANLIRQIKAGKKSTEAFDSVYEGGFSQFNSDFLKYISKK